MPRRCAYSSDENSRRPLDINSAVLRATSSVLSQFQDFGAIVLRFAIFVSPLQRFSSASISASAHSASISSIFACSACARSWMLGSRGSEVRITRTSCALISLRLRAEPGSACESEISCRCAIFVSPLGRAVAIRLSKSSVLQPSCQLPSCRFQRVAVYATSAHTRRALGAVVAQACSDPPERGELPYQLLWTERIDQLPALVTLPSAVARELG